MIKAKSKEKTKSTTGENPFGFFSIIEEHSNREGSHVCSFPIIIRAENFTATRTRTPLSQT
jgi:hypothetical protein